MSRGPAGAASGVLEARRHARTEGGEEQRVALRLGARGCQERSEDQRGEDQGCKTHQQPKITKKAVRRVVVTTFLSIFYSFARPVTSFHDTFSKGGMQDASFIVVPTFFNSKHRPVTSFA